VNPHAILSAQRDVMNRPRTEARRNFPGESFQQVGENQRRLHHRKLFPDTRPRPTGEREKRKIIFSLFSVIEALWRPAQWIVPETVIPVSDPLKTDDIGTFRNLIPINHIT